MYQKYRDALTRVLSSHLYFNIPPAVLLTFFCYPLATSLDVYKVTFLIVVSRSIGLMTSASLMLR